MQRPFQELALTVGYRPPIWRIVAKAAHHWLRAIPGSIPEIAELRATLLLLAMASLLLWALPFPPYFG